MAFARGKYSQAISDRSGQAFPYSEMVKEWNGSLVHQSEYEPKHPQLEPKPKGGDAQGLQNARPARTEPATPVLLNSNAFTATASSTTISVFEENHGRTTGDTVCFRDVVAAFAIEDANNTSGFTITVTNANNYTFTSTDTANGSGKFGGSVASAGPVTISS
jgi:hypothetical protein